MSLFDKILTSTKMEEGTIKKEYIDISSMREYHEVSNGEELLKQLDLLEMQKTLTLEHRFQKHLNGVYSFT